MPTFYSSVASTLANRPSFIALNLDATPAAQLAPTLVQPAGQLPAQVLVDCASLQALRALGVSHVVSELLRLRQSGAQIWLGNVDPVLHHCLRLLRLDPFFLLAE